MNKENRNIRTPLGNYTRYLALWLLPLGSCAKGGMLQQGDTPSTSQAHSNIAAATNQINICDNVFQGIMDAGNVNTKIVVNLYDSCSGLHRYMIATSVWNYWGGRFCKAVIGNYTGIVRILFENPRLNTPIDVNQTDDRGRTLLHIAMDHENLAMARLLVEAGAAGIDRPNPNRNNETLLHLAAQHGDQDMVQLLLDRGANVNAVTNCHWTVLHLAASNGHQAVAQLLLDYGAKANAAINFDGTTALHLAARNGHQAVTQLLLDRGAKINAVNDDNQTALYLATRIGHQSVAQLLLDRGAKD